MPWTPSQRATCPMLASWVRPERISSPITTSAAVQMRGDSAMQPALGERRRCAKRGGTGGCPSQARRGTLTGRVEQHPLARLLEPENPVVERGLHVLAVAQVVHVEPPRLRLRVLRQLGARSLDVARRGQAEHGVLFEARG